MLRIDRDPICEVWTVDRPDVANAIDRSTVHALEVALGGVIANPPRGLVIASAPRPEGARPVYLSGADLDEVTAIESAEQARAFSLRMTTLLRTLESLPLLVVAAISGDTYGGGCELITACDLRIAQPGVQLSFRQARMGLATGWGGTTRIVHLIGLGAAKRLMLTGLPCEAEEALRIGLIDEIAPDARARAIQIVHATAAGGRAAVARLKAGLHDALKTDEETSYGRELDRFVEAWSSDEHRAAVNALRAKRR
jgi:enoyl-CoA hydratase/carnithine racemase